MKKYQLIEVLYRCSLVLIFLSGLPFAFSGYRAFQSLLKHSFYIDNAGKAYGYGSLGEELWSLGMHLLLLFVVFDFCYMILSKQKFRWKKDLSSIRLIKCLYCLGILFELFKQSLLSMVTPDKSWYGVVVWMWMSTFGIIIFKYYLSYLSNKKIDLAEDNKLQEE
ncbi:hypothetical protein DUI36_12075 [Enterococcus faecium]|nr:hypothetical protein [Enterococcus faecium]